MRRGGAFATVGSARGEPRTRVTATYDPGGGMGGAAAWAARREALGYDALYFPEAAHDPFAALALAAEHTSRVRLGTGAAIAFARSPYVAAHLGWDLQEFSRGRLLLGLGAQVRAHNERRFSAPWGPPAPRLREYVEAMRAAWRAWRTGERPAFEGEHYRYTLDTWRFNPGPIGWPDPPVALAAGGPRLARLAAEVADGVLWPSLLGREWRDETLLPAFEAGARAAGKDPRGLAISGGGFVVTAPDEARLVEALGEARRAIAFAASTPEYRAGVARAGFGDEAAMLHRLSREGRWAEMAKLVGDDFVEAFAVVATWDDLPARMAERYAGVNTEIAFPADVATPEDEARARETIVRLRAIPAYGETGPRAGGEASDGADGR